MAHVNQERYSTMVDAKLRAVLVKKDGVIFNNRYEGDAKAGAGEASDDAERALL